MSASQTLRQAIYQRLSGDSALIALLGGDHVYDHVPHGARFPYVTFGQGTVYDWGTATEAGEEHLVTLHAWSKARGRKQVLDIVDAVMTAVEALPLSLAGHALINLLAERLEIRFDDDLDGYHGLIRYRAVTEPTA